MPSCGFWSVHCAKDEQRAMTTEQITMAVDTPRRRVRGHHLLLAAFALAVVVAVRLKWFTGASEAAPVTAAIPQSVVTTRTDESTAVAPATDAALSPDEQFQQKLAGSWRDKFYGERTMTFQPGGTGVMVIKLDTAGRLLYGEKLTIQLSWSITDGVLHMRFTGGEPKWAMSTIIQGWGAEHDQRIELIDEADLHLRSTDSGNLYQLKRVEESAESSSSK
jgi:hypothetical protein